MCSRDGDATPAEIVIGLLKERADAFNSGELYGRYCGFKADVSSRRIGGVHGFGCQLQ